MADEGREAMKQMLANATLWDNGQVVCLCQNGNPMPELEGHYDDVKCLVMEASHAFTVFYIGSNGDPMGDFRRVPREEWW